MLEEITLIAKVLGINAKDFYKGVQKIRKSINNKKIKVRKKQEAAFVNYETITSLISRYYGLEDAGSGIKRYSSIIEQKERPTTIYTKPCWLSLNRPPDKIPMELLSRNDDNFTPKSYPSMIIDYAQKVYDRLNRMDVKFWQESLYRLVEIGEGEKLNLKFSKSNFLDYKFTSGLCSEELTDALINSKGKVDNVSIEKTSDLEVRKILLPSLRSLTDFKSRICSSGMGMVLAFARGGPNNDFVIPMQIRSAQVSDARGKFAVIPKGYHQPCVDDAMEINIHWTGLREVFEEIFKGEEAERDIEVFKHDWYCDNFAFMEYFRDHVGAFNYEMIACGIDAITGSFEMTLLLVVRDTWYWKKYGSSMEKMWESKEVKTFSTMDENEIKSLFIQNDWSSESIFHLAEGLIRLKELVPNRVRLPEIIRVLGEGKKEE